MILIYSDLSEKELKWTKIDPFNTCSMGKKEKRAAIQCFMTDNALDVMFYQRLGSECVMMRPSMLT